MIRPKATQPIVLGGERLATSLLHGNWLYWPSLVFRVDALERRTFRQDLPIILDLALIMDGVVGGQPAAARTRRLLLLPSPRRERVVDRAAAG